jgi:hypothetical protein
MQTKFRLSVLLSMLERLIIDDGAIVLYSVEILPLLPCPDSGYSINKASIQGEGRWRLPLRIDPGVRNELWPSV